MASENSQNKDNTGPSAVVKTEIDYEKAKNLARHDHIETRTALAAHPATKPEILYYMTTDAADSVRAAVAANPITPRQADVLLSQDRAVTVRATLAGKIARLVPNLPQRQLDQIEQLTIDILQTLARDQATIVRQTIAEIVKDSPHVPKNIIDLLARDLEIAVADPVLRCSPLLTDEDLVQIISASPIAGALEAIAERKKVPASVADAIAASNKRDAITALLGNPSAQIREETLDRLIDQAPSVVEWHLPITKRPSLTAKAVQKLTLFVTDALLSLLAARPDIDALTAKSIEQTVKQRLQAHPTLATSQEAIAKPVKDSKAAAKAKKSKAGQDAPLKVETYTEDSMAQALDLAKYDYVRKGLAEMNQLPFTLVEQILASHSARGVVSLVWRAGLPMRFALQVQKQIAHIPPTQILNARGGFDYPMTEDEMLWQLDFFGVPHTKPDGSSNKKKA